MHSNVPLDIGHFIEESFQTVNYIGTDNHDIIINRPSWTNMLMCYFLYCTHFSMTSTLAAAGHRGCHAKIFGWAKYVAHARPTFYK